MKNDKCKLCSAKTNNVFNIKFKAIPICESCAATIFLQQAMWYTNTFPIISETIPVANKMFAGSKPMDGDELEALNAAYKKQLKKTPTRF